MARRGKFKKAALLVGAAAVAAGIVLKREKIAGLLPSRSQSGGQDGGWAPAPAPTPSEPEAAPAPVTPAAPQSGQEPAGVVPFGAGTTAEPEPEPVPQPEPEPEPEPIASAPEPEPPATPGVPRTGSWQPPAPPSPPESSDPTPPSEQQPLPKQGDEDDGDELRTWSGRAINP